MAFDESRLPLPAYLDAAIQRGNAWVFDQRHVVVAGPHTNPLNGSSGLLIEFVEPSVAESDGFLADLDHACPDLVSLEVTMRVAAGTVVGHPWRRTISVMQLVGNVHASCRTHGRKLRVDCVDDSEGRAAVSTALVTSASDADRTVDPARARAYFDALLMSESVEAFVCHDDIRVLGGAVFARGQRDPPTGTCFDELVDVWHTVESPTSLRTCVQDCLLDAGFDGDARTVLWGHVAWPAHEPDDRGSAVLGRLTASGWREHHSFWRVPPRAPIIDREAEGTRT